MRFRATLELHGKTATGLRVPDDIVEGLGAGKKPAVHVRVGDYGYRSTIARMGGVYMLPFSSEHRAATGLRAGDEVDVDVELDTDPREVEIPDDLADALAAADATDAFRRLSYSNQRAHALSVEAAKAADTRARRIEKVVTGVRAV